MHICFLTSHFPFHGEKSVGGIGTSIKNLAIGLLAQGVSVRVLVYGQNEDRVFITDGITIQKIKNIKFKGLSWYLTRKKIEKIINKLYADGVIDLVEAPDWTGITSFIKPKSCPIIIKLNGSDTYFCHLDNRPVKWINKFHEKRALQNADGLLSVSQFTADQTNRVFGLQKQFAIIPNSIDITSFEEDKLIPSLSNTVLYFGSLIRKKGLLELPFIFNELIRLNPSAKLVLVGGDVPDIISGSPSTWKMMQGLFSSQALLNVNYLGRVPHQDIQKYISESTVCVFPSFAEALPVSWIEAMAMQKAIVASNIGWAKDIIDDGINGFLVHPKNHIEYASKINILLSDIQKRKYFGILAREKVIKKFNISVVAQQSLVYYKQYLIK